MKKNNLILIAIALIATTSVFTGCKKKSTDITPPYMTILGANPYYIQKSWIWAEPGAIASDDIDGKVAATASGAINTGNAGVYYVNYTATDNSGNVTTLTRTVYVVDLNGPYSIAKLISPYPVGDTTITTNTNMTLSTDGTGKLAISNFANYANANVYCTLSGMNSLNIPVQTVTCGTAPTIYARTFSGTGTINPTYNYTNQIVINFTELTLNISPSVSSQESFFR